MIGLGLGDEDAEEAGERGVELDTGPLEPEAHVGGDLVVATATGMEFGGGGGAAAEGLLDVHVDILEGDVPGESAGFDFGVDFLEAADDGIAFGGGEEADLGEHAGLGLGALDVERGEPLVKGDGLAELQHERGRALAKTTAPGGVFARGVGGGDADRARFAGSFRHGGFLRFRGADGKQRIQRGCIYSEAAEGRPGAFFIASGRGRGVTSEAMSGSNGAGWRVKGLRYERAGAPAEVLALVERKVPAPGAGEALVALRVAGIHYSDLGLINGSYGKTRVLPAIAGREAVGEVVAVGQGTGGVAVGELVQMPPEAGVWTEAVVARAEELWRIPAGVAVEQAALGFINPPTAWRMLHDFVELKPGDWIIQNAGTSAVGVLVMQLARHFGWRVVSVVRDAAVAGRLQAEGATVVVAEDSGYEKEPLKLTGGAPLKLALNAVGGESAGRLCRAVAAGGVVVTYGGVTSKPMRFPTRPLIFNDVTLRGFWLDKWMRGCAPAEARAFLERIFELLRDGVMRQPVAARYPLEDWRAALDRAFRGGREGKIIFTSAWRP